MSVLTSNTNAQKIDFDFPGRNTSEVTQTNFIPWPVGRVTSESKTLDNGVKITIAAADGATGLASNWSKKNIQNGNKLLNDGVFACYLSNGDYQWITEGQTAITLTIEGLSAGQHSLVAYHNDTDAGQTHPDVEVSVDGVVKTSGVKHSAGAQTLADSGTSFVEFIVSENQPVVVKFACVPEEGKTYNRTSVMLNGIEIDANPYRIMESQPANYDYHVAADDGQLTLSWLPADIAVSHRLVFGTVSATVADASTYQYEGSGTSYTVNNLSPLVRYWWRVDEVDADGKVYQGQTMAFQTRRDAFPGAEGYGRYAIGGRGGVVYHVTTLDDNGNDNNPVAGSLRYGIKKVQGPRTIVFDVAGTIALQSRLTCSDPFVTIAGQTAPGRGIMLRGCPLGMASDGITRFIRMRRGHIIDEADANKGLDGLGMAGNDHAIMDHCSISWTIDEGFSSRGAKNITLQRTLISEALNIAGHPNYDAGTAHGYAATIGGGENGGKGSSYHHNLLAHNEGRNWSMSGGLDGKGEYDGHHDMFNNVCYNWGGRATDGGTHEGQFVANYYKMGPASTKRIILEATLEGPHPGTQSYYVNGNIRENTNGTKTHDKEGDTYEKKVKAVHTQEWDVFVNQPFFESLATIETAEAAYKNVLSDVGCNQPALDNHDQRMVQETFSGTTSTIGSKSRKKGLIDHEDDAEGFDGLNIYETVRPADWDTDQDGIPDWFEAIVGTDPLAANNNDDRDGDHYTDLEEYLNWLSLPHFFLNWDEPQTIDLYPYFAGYENPVFTLSPQMDNGSDWQVTNGELLLWCKNKKLNTVEVTATENGISLTRAFHFVVNPSLAGICDAKISQPARHTPVYYNLAGQRLLHPQKGLNIEKGRKVIIK